LELGEVISAQEAITCWTDDRTDGRDDFAQGHVAEVILCDVSRMALLSHIPRCWTMKKSRSQELSEKFAEEWQRSRDWLVPYMQNNQPKFLTKDELRVAAMRELNVSKNAFDFGWIAAIEDTGRHDWYEPLRKRLRTKS
jgi:hypothetical protein